MYTLRVRGTVAAGKATAFEAWYQRSIANLKQQPGYQRCALFNSLGYPAQYTSILTFDDRQAARTCLRGPFLQFLAADPFADLIASLEPAEAYELVHTTVGTLPAVGAVTALVDISTDIAQTQAFEASRTELLNIIRQHGKGFVRNALWRFAGAPGRYLIAYAHASSDDLATMIAMPEVARFLEANPLTKFGAAVMSVESCEIVLADLPVGAAVRG